ncbi:hypothetical protein FISHEDRAFT_75095 [Fistulina hepatica ATCC 64428]|uniref:Borealin N-terminal domain-containing protein n=1 Tax=Fistulina hepatica ATCC 64428 TaxID=1128425 RepID=A0A0D7A8K3_9AGAR|nr:hypothetical protein FISHEDRAFT_75095 [Fistulina hepatica ATCC 64428]
MSFEISYSREEKNILLRNFDLEVDDRLSKLKAQLEFELNDYRDRQETLLRSIPTEVRSMKMREFGMKYGGDIRAAVLGVRADIARSSVSEKLAGKRKADEKIEELRLAKNARLHSPKKRPLGFTPQKSRHVSNPFGARNSPTSRQTPQKARLPFMPSPSKQTVKSGSTHRVPSSSSFNPSMPAHAPAYPSGAFAAAPPRTLKRMKSGIIVRNASETQKTGSTTLTPKPASSSTLPAPSSSQSFVTPARKGHQRTLSRARSVISLSTTSGHVLEFDPIANSPRDIDALEGITDSAKRDVKLEMSRLVLATAQKWTVGS